MSSVADVSLAVIAAASTAAAIAAIPVLVQIRRTAKQAEAVLVRVDRELPGLLVELRAIIDAVGEVAETVRGLSASVERLDRFIHSTTRTVEEVRDSARHVAEDVVMPTMATAAGVLAALRESMQWVRSRRDRGRDGP